MPTSKTEEREPLPHESAMQAIRDALESGDKKTFDSRVEAFINDFWVYRDDLFSSDLFYKALSTLKDKSAQFVIQSQELSQGATLRLTNATTKELGMFSPPKNSSLKDTPYGKWVKEIVVFAAKSEIPVPYPKWSFEDEDLLRDLKKASSIDAAACTIL